MSRTIVDENNNKLVVMEIGRSGQGSMPPGGKFVEPTMSTLEFSFEDGKKVTRTAKAGDIDNMTDDELLDLLKKDSEGCE